MGQDKKFSIDIPSGGINWSSDGTYTITVLYGSEDIKTEITFEFESSDSFPPFPSDDVDKPKPTPKNDDDDEPSKIIPNTEDDEPTTPKNEVVPIDSQPVIPDWIRDTAGWWAEGTVDDSSFTEGISFLIKENIIIIPDLPNPSDSNGKGIPEWIKKTAGWWAEKLTTDQEFSNAIKFLVENGIIEIES
ncbi:MAG: hypothetical protein ACE5H1_12020 [Thermodesulfobacteriota bacterium]